MRARLAAVGIAAAVIGGGVLVALPSPPGGRSLLVVRTLEGTTAIDIAAGAPIIEVPQGVGSPDGAIIVRALQTRDATLLVAYDAASGEQSWSRAVPGDLAVRLVGADLTTVVLEPSDAISSMYAPQPRARTRLVVSRPGGHREFDLEGNFEPEALATNGHSLFVISYLPPTAPDRYQVRRLNLNSGAVEEVFTPDAELQQSMGGTARTQAWAPDATRLYTLYTHDVDGRQRAFIHVLDLDELWAHCVDLPEEFLASDEAAVALATSPDGSRLYVADRREGVLAEIDTARLEVVRTAPVPRIPLSDAVASAAVSADGRVVLAAANRVLVLSPDALEREASWAAGSEIAGLHAGPDPGALTVLLSQGRAVVADLLSGDQQLNFAVPGGPIEPPRGIDKGPGDDGEALECAC